MNETPEDASIRHRPTRPEDELDELGHRIAELSAQISAATYQLLVMIREFDERSGWDCGFRSCAHWLNWRVGLNLGAAREKVRVARALANLPLISEAMRNGEISYSKARALTRVANQENEEGLLGFAKASTAAHLEKLVRGLSFTDRFAAMEREERRRAGRFFSAHTDSDGMLVVRARLEPEVGAALMKALEAAADRLFEEGRDKAEPAKERLPYSHRLADAVGVVAESALAQGLDPGTRGDRYQVVVHVEENVLSGAAESGESRLDDGADVSAETCRRVSCDSSIVVIRHDETGHILDVGRKTRVISPALRRALQRRDGGCRFPGCGCKICDGHHIEHWADGGETKLSNVISLCKRHHRAVHEEGHRIEVGEDGALRFLRPDGLLIPDAPPLSATAAPPAALIERLLDDGVAVDPWTGFPTWEGGPVDYNWAIEAWLQPRPHSP